MSDIKTRRRLIEKECPRLLRQSSSNANTLMLPAREGFHLPMG
jgi:hypothetical protein